MNLKQGPIEKAKSLLGKHDSLIDCFEQLKSRTLVDLLSVYILRHTAGLWQSKVLLHQLA